ncbi:sensor histidine kinase [Haloarcula marina]|uniref:sensor histidine kinase n=1 Tax=Haloarcula marina TaxID=2961574 RepID=UPI0020B6EC7C|nr:PAS domain-containing sensor histidine kinase [Halomicroarcula marina]
MAGDGRRLEQALDTLDEVVYVYDESFRLVHWNQRLNDLFDLSDAELEGMRPTDFFEDGDHAGIAAALEEIVETGETVVEAWAQTTEGRVRFELTGRLLTDDDGTMRGFAGIGRDVTDRHEREWLLSRQNQRLDEFADILAHDLRNPLAVANGHLELARQEQESDALSAVGDAHRRMGRIIDDIRTATQTGALAATLEPVDVAAVAAAAWESVETHGARLDLPEALTVDADAQRLRRLFENLFRNAVEHGSTSNSPWTDDGETTDRAVRVRLVETDAGFAIEDDGPGINSVDSERIFDPGVSGATDGTGFGLYIVRTIAEAHGWTVRATESETGGARFEFDLRPS